MMMWQELDHVVEELEKFAVVHLLQRRSIISLIGNVQRSSLILEKVIELPTVQLATLTPCDSELPC
jgi:aspartate kinase